MLVSEFVSITLTEILRGVKDAQGKVAEDGGKVAPPIETHSALPTPRTRDHRYDAVEMVDFDLSVTTTEGDELGVSILSAFKVQTSDGQISVNRIRFKMPVVYPVASNS